MPGVYRKSLVTDPEASLISVVQNLSHREPSSPRSVPPKRLRTRSKLSLSINWAPVGQRRLDPALAHRVGMLTDRGVHVAGKDLLGGLKSAVDADEQDLLPQVAGGDVLDRSQSHLVIGTTPR